eukprot:TRINITY_DN2724_c1_g1_i1.p1 TRINITY_DN2724_c1_g1~~TRINITY_DN2724_c1_g1_i1.p1  ORF type:complete len:385 (-),score=41.10 TRINITY_DN2724_c1_g1_i1:488-1642(-)
MLRLVRPCRYSPKQSLTQNRRKIHIMNSSDCNINQPVASQSELHQPGTTFDLEQFEKQRLELDAKARETMQVQSQIESKSEEVQSGSVRGAWKWAIRKRIWDLLEDKDIARFPRPVHHRIPNFLNAERAAMRLAELDVFKSANCVKVNPDTPQKPVRINVLNQRKLLLVPQPRLRTGFFSKLHAEHIPQGAINEACTSAGVQKYGVPVKLEDKLQVDLIVIGSVAVSRTGARLGKGEGFAELEYGMLRWMGAIDDSTPVVTTIHDEQLVDDIDPIKLLEHDVPVDIIVTPTQVIYTNTKIPKPQGILWDKLSPQKLGQIRILQQLKRKIEEETGVKLPSGPDEELPPTASRQNQGRGRGRRDGRGGGRGRNGGRSMGRGGGRGF